MLARVRRQDDHWGSRAASLDPLAYCAANGAWISVESQPIITTVLLPWSTMETSAPRRLSSTRCS